MEDSAEKLFCRRLSIRREWRVAFFSVWIAGLVTHGYQIANFLLNGDGEYNLHAPGGTLIEGRCFLPLATAVRSSYSLPWLCGLLALLWLSLAVVLLVDLLEVHSPVFIVLIAAFFASCPTVTCAYAYSFMVDSSMLDFLLAVAAIYLAHKCPRWGRFAGALCICFGLGIYQAYLTVAVSTILMLAILQVVRQQASIKQLFQTYWKDFLMLLGGTILYKVLLEVLLCVTHTELIDYQGINKVGLMSLYQYYLAVLKTLDKLMRALGLINGPFYSINSFINFVLLGLLAIGTVAIIYQKKLYRRASVLIAFLVLVGSLFFVPFAINFVSPSVQYHALMEMGLCYPFVLLILYLPELRWNKALRVFGASSVVFLALLSWHNTVNANIAYYIMQFNYERSAYAASDILGQLRAQEGFDPASSPVAVTGRWYAYGTDRMSTDPVLVGISDDIFLNDQQHYLLYWDYFFGMPITGASTEQISAVEQTEEYAAMPEYPAAGCVQEIDGVYVVKLPQTAS